MSNKLKTLSAAQLEDLIESTISEYLNEECDCLVSDLDTPYIDTEADIGDQYERNMTFHVKLSYQESD